MPTLERNTFLLFFCALFFVSCDPPEFKENTFNSSFLKSEPKKKTLI